MHNQTPARPCGACLQPGNRVITEAFTDNGSAFKRHAQLVAGGNAPSLCMRRDGTANVCHLGRQAG